MTKTTGTQTKKSHVKFRRGASASIIRVLRESISRTTVPGALLNRSQSMQGKYFIVTTRNWCPWKSSRRSKERKVTTLTYLPTYPPIFFTRTALKEQQKKRKQKKPAIGVPTTEKTKKWPKERSVNFGWRCVLILFLKEVKSQAVGNADLGRLFHG